MLKVLNLHIQKVEVLHGCSLKIFSNKPFTRKLYRKSQKRLTSFMLLVSSYTPWEYQKSTAFQMFSDGYRKGCVVKNEVLIKNFVQLGNAC